MIGAARSPIDVLVERGLLDWPTLRVGRRRGWVSKADAIAHAVRRLVEDPSDVRLALAELAGADQDEEERVDELVDELARWDDDEGLDAAATIAIGKRWDYARLHHLLATNTPDEIAARADEHWAVLDYPRRSGR